MNLQDESRGRHRATNAKLFATNLLACLVACAPPLETRYEYIKTLAGDEAMRHLGELKYDDLRELARGASRAATEH